jgi:hypothetical protein
MSCLDSFFTATIGCNGASVAMTPNLPLSAQAFRCTIQTAAFVRIAHHEKHALHCVFGAATGFERSLHGHEHALRELVGELSPLFDWGLELR